MKRYLPCLILIIPMLLLAAILLPSAVGMGSISQITTTQDYLNYLPIITNNYTPLSILLGSINIEQGIFLDSGGDVDTEVVTVGNPPSEARRTGNGSVLPSPDGNMVPDYYMQFRIDNNVIFEGVPTTRVRIDVEYYDQGTDSFGIQYDSSSEAFKFVTLITKGDTGSFKVVSVYLCDAYFGDRVNGGDFRITDNGDGAEIIRRVWVTLLKSGVAKINVDSCGANPWDTNPDSEAIQRCVDLACPGDTVLFTSRTYFRPYQGYQIDKTIYLVANTVKTNLTFTATDPNNRALLQATDDLKGFVVNVTPRSQVPNYGDVDNLTISHLHIDGNRDNRVCFGADEIGNGQDDNWGSWLPTECQNYGDGMCYPGGLNMCGATDLGDVNQDYQGNPSAWSTGFVVDDLLISNVECATALALCAADSTIKDTTIDIAGDHTHVSTCAQTDPDEPMGGWSDGITSEGPGNVIMGNTILDASDVGIVFFGGRDTIISNNTIQARPGNYGMFAAIAVHPWGWGDVSGMEVTGNVVTNTADITCGGIHAGINIGTHMWSGGCVQWADLVAVGNPNVCTAEPPQPNGTHCIQGQPCQIWAHVAAGETFTLENNRVAGAQVNYLIEGLDLVGTLVESGNISITPRMTDWEDDADCWMGGGNDSWTTIDFAAHHPTVPGWTDQRIHCER
jgi:parallel beta-helix repeat protein